MNWDHSALSTSVLSFSSVLFEPKKVRAMTAMMTEMTPVRVSHSQDREQNGIGNVLLRVQHIR